MPVTTTILANEPEPPPVGIPITDEELAMNRNWKGPRSSPLVRWSRLEPYLRARLGAVVSGAALDLPRLTRMIGKGLPLYFLPRRKRTTWAAQALVLWDDSPDMHGFKEDAAFLLTHLRRERGRHGLKVVTLRSLPDPSDLRKVPLGVPVLALSSLGQAAGSCTSTVAWLAMARALDYRSHSFQGLSPCPRRRWRGDVATAWPMAVWDRHPRLPRQGGLRHFGDAAGGDPEATRTLLDWLSPASRIEPGLLREVRLALGKGFDAGTERDAWHHEDCWQAPDAFGFKPGATYEERLARRAEAARREPALAEAIGRRIQEYHGACSPVVAAEAALRACLSGSPNAASLEDLAVLFGKVVNRLRDMASRPGSREGRRTGLARWFDGMVGRLTPAMRSRPDFAEAIARGLALAKYFEGAARIEWPEGIDRRVAQVESTSAAGRLPAPVNYQLAQQGNKLVVLAQSLSCQAMPLGLVRAGSPSLHLDVALKAHGESSSSTFQLPIRPGRVPLVALNEAVPFQIESDRQQLGFTAISRPAWARKMWYDRYGLAAEFAVKGVAFVLRWIPPGRFMMGSPEDEPGRYDDEGPRHERVIPNGFWLGETPVTQAQWAVVMGRNPSHFKGPDVLPVESVRWQECRDFARVVSRLTGGPAFRLPTEVEWEYACRAGTESALWTGPITLNADHDAPELECIAWYIGNSCRDIDVSNPRETKDFMVQHPDGLQASNHCVKRKVANPWGLYDMLGNVWEWCEDSWDRDAYRKVLAGGAHSAVGKDERHVVRGGSWSVRARSCRTAIRGRSASGERRNNLGLRLAAGRTQEAEEPIDEFGGSR